MPVGGIELFVRTVIARAYPRVIGANREKSWLFFDIFLPLLSTSAYVLVYRALGAPEEYVGFVVIGGAMTAFWFNVLWGMSSQLYWDKEAGNLALYIASPGPLMAILMGMAIGGLFRTVVRAVAIVFFGTVLFGVSFSSAHLLPLFLVFVLTMAALYGMGMLLASLFLLFGREAWHTSNLLQEPVFLLSGFYFPVKQLGFWIAAGASLIPLTLGLDAMRQLLFPTDTTFGFLSVGREVAILLGLSLLFITVARFSLRHMERLSKREGRLTERGR